MKKSWDKGFIMAETIVVSTVVIAALLIIYLQFISLNNSYERSVTYNNVNDIYALNNVKKMIMNDDFYKMTDALDNESYIDITGCPSNYFIEYHYCRALLETTGIKKLILTHEDTYDLNNEIKNKNDISQGLRTYIKTISSNKNDKYRLIAEFDGTYATIKLGSFTPKKYTVRRLLTSTSSAWERYDDAVGKVANATKNGSTVTNDFDNIYPWSDIISYNYDTTTGRQMAEYGDPSFKFDGSNGDVLTRIPTFYYKRWQENGYEYQSISKYPIEGYTRSEQFSVGRYTSSYDTKLHSKSGVLPKVQQNITWFRNESNKLGSDFGQMDYHYNLIQMLYLVEYADYNSQSKLGNGITQYRMSSDGKALVAENSANRIIINTTSANGFIVGQPINIGNGSVWSNSIAANRTITKKESYSANGVTGTAVYFDGAAVNITTNSVLASSATASGQTNSLGMKSGTLNNDGKHSMIYRGMEDIFGNIYQFVDGINVKDNIAYVSTDKNDYAVDKFDGTYHALGYTNAQTDGSPKTLGYDSNNPLFAFPTEVGTNVVTDYYYRNSGNRIALVDGYWANYSVAGLWCWYLNYASSYSAVDVGSRLIRLN